MSKEHNSGQRERILELSEENMTERFRGIAREYGSIDPATLSQSNDRYLRRLFSVYDSWVKTQQKKVDQAGGTIQAQLQMALKVTPFFVELGFTDPFYVDEVVNVWMSQDLAQAEDAGLDDEAAAIREKIGTLSRHLPDRT